MSSADPTTALPGIGAARAAALAAAGLATVGDVARLAPRALAEVGPKLDLAAASRTRGAWVRVRGALVSLAWTRLGPRRQSALRATLQDASGRLDALFVGQPWLKKRLELGSEVELYGRVGGSRAPVLVAPRLGAPAAEAGALEPVYPRVDGFSDAALRALVRRAFAEVRDELAEELPADVLARLGVPALPDALAACHAPGSREAFERARRRLALDVLVGVQARLVERLARRGGRGRAGDAPCVRVGPAALDALWARLPFQPTDGQRRVAAEIAADLARPAPMRRLLQGDVGAGKTAVALVACLAVRDAGFQAAFMAPTELLAEQQLEAARPLAEASGLRVALLTGSLAPQRRRAVLDALARGDIDLVFGTHALFSGDVAFSRLALVVIDEQHRFGVAQRRRLLEKGAGVHALLMTATPIPRTLALTLYGDLDASALREKPPGRQAIATRLVPHGKRADLVGWLGGRLASGERAFWVLPRIESSEDGPGAEAVHAAFASGALARYGVELVHGRQEPERRLAALARFRSGDARLLVGTTVLEVGVDVPDATIMVVEGAERFGLAQLHQLRGRVGRGARASSCFLLTEARRAQRLEVLARTDDGFAIAEEDLRQRGMGDLAGLRQSGANAEGLAGFEDDVALWSAARELVQVDAALRARVLARTRSAAP